MAVGREKDGEERAPHQPKMTFKQSWFSCVEMTTWKRGGLWVAWIGEGTWEKTITQKKYIRKKEDIWVTDLKLDLCGYSWWLTGENGMRDGTIKGTSWNSWSHESEVLYLLWIGPSCCVDTGTHKPEAHQFDFANWLGIYKDVSLSPLTLLQVSSNIPRYLYEYISNSGSHACASSSLATEPPLRPLEYFVFLHELLPTLIF